MSLETRQQVATHLLAARALVEAALELVCTDAGVHTVFYAIASAQAELRAARKLLSDCQIRCELDKLARQEDLSRAIERLTVLAGVATKG